MFPALQTAATRAGIPSHMDRAFPWPFPATRCGISVGRVQPHRAPAHATSPAVQPLPLLLGMARPTPETKASVKKAQTAQSRPTVDVKKPHRSATA